MEGFEVTKIGKHIFCILDAGNSSFYMVEGDEKAAVIDTGITTGKKITLSKKMAAALLKDGEISVKGIFSEKTGKSYDATLVLNDDGVKTVYSLAFDKS